MIEKVHHVLSHFNFYEVFPDDSQIMLVSYDYTLVVISYLIAAIAGYTGLSLSRLIKERKSLNVHSNGLIALGSLAMGLGIWAMHFIAMLAYSIDTPISYDMTITAFSVLPAFISSWITLHSMAGKKLTLTRLALLGLVIGMGIGAMHYIGMGAMIQQAIPAYHTGTFIVSLVLAWLLGMFTVYIRFSPLIRKFLSRTWSDIISGAIWGASVAAIHYTGMAAAFFMPGEMHHMGQGVPAELLIAPVSLVSFILVLSSLILTSFQRRIQSISIEAEANRERLVEAMEEMSDGMVITDENNIISMVNQQMIKMMPGAGDYLCPGLPLDDFLAWLTHELLLEDMIDIEREQFIQCLLAIQGCENSMELQLHDDRWIMIRQNRTQSGTIMRIWSDITAYKQAESAIYQEDKMESLGRMVAGVAHEVNTPLGICLTLASQLDEETRTISEQYKNREMSQKQFEQYLSSTNNISEIFLTNIRRSADLIRNFKQVAVDQSHLETEKISLKEYTEQVFRTLHSEYKNLNPSIEINGPGELQIETLPGAYSQIIINLVKNSVLHAFENIDQPVMSVSFNQQDDDVIVEYRDNGVGMDKETLDKIFDPFFTTKRQQGGTGLGMHIVFNLVSQKLKGQLKVESKPGAGSCFTIRLPLQLETPLPASQTSTG